MATWLRQSTNIELPFGPFLDSVDGNTQKTALTIAQANVRVKKGGAAWVSKNFNQNSAHEEAGWYEVVIDSIDSNTLGPLAVAIHVAGALPVWREFMVVPQPVYDAMVAGTSPLPVNATQIEGIDATNQIRDSVFGGVVENGKTFVQLVRGMVAALIGKSAGLDTATATFRDNADAKNRITATVDGVGNRSAVATDLD